MSNGFGCLPMARAAHRLGVLLLLMMLAGCATAPGKQTPPGSIPWSLRYRPSTPQDGSARPPRKVLALSGGSTLGGEPTGDAIQGYNVPGRNPNSQMPWEFFLGSAAHRIIAYMYGVNHPGNQAFFRAGPSRVARTFTGRF